MTSPFGIYIHFPFCKSKCPYCDFFSKVKKDIDHQQLVDGWVQELDFYAAHTVGRTVGSVFFGGGTPSLLPTPYIEQILNQIAKRWPLASNVEISLEANPNSNTPHLFADLRTAGINRLSLGVQALNAADLKFLGRTHSLPDALQAIEQITQTFDNHSIDLIYARPNQTADAWQAELTQAVSFGLKHISLYQLTIEENTAFAKCGVQALEENQAAAMYEFTTDYLQAHGYPRYEVSNYAQPGFACRHNLLYWQGDDYLGIGTAAHGRVKSAGQFYATTHCCQLESLTPTERAEELVLMGLRLEQGIDKNHFQNICGLKLEDRINQQHLHRLIASGLLCDTATDLRATPAGFLVLNKLIEELLT